MNKYYSDDIHLLDFNFDAGLLDTVFVNSSPSILEFCPIFSHWILVEGAGTSLAWKLFSTGIIETQNRITTSLISIVSKPIKVVVVVINVAGFVKKI